MPSVMVGGGGGAETKHQKTPPHTHTHTHNDTICKNMSRIACANYPLFSLQNKQTNTKSLTNYLHNLLVFGLLIIGG